MQVRCQKSIINWIVFLSFAIFMACSISHTPKIERSKSPNSNTETDQKLARFFNQVLEDFRLPGFAVGIVKGGEVVYAKGFGYENINTRKPVTKQTVFHMASVSKPFVATAIMKLVSEGKIHLDSTLVSYLPYFKMDSKEYEDITIRHALSHSTGMRSSNGYDWENPTYTSDAIENYVKSLVGEKLLSKPGEKFTYSNIAYDCLGDVIAKVTGTSFSDYMENFILHPCGMNQSSFLKPDYLPENWAAPHNRILVTEVWAGYPYNRMHAPSSTLHANIEDMCKWAITNLNKGVYGDNRILESATYDQLWRPWTVTGWGTEIGLGWFLESYKGQEIIEHSGGDTGFSSQMILIPESSIAIVVMVNQSPSPFETIAYGAIDILQNRLPDDYKIPVVIPFGLAMENEGFEAAEKLWYRLRSEQADKYSFSVYQLNNLARKLYRNERKEEALKVILFNATKFPNDPISHDTYGDFLLGDKDTTMAIDQYRKALRINPQYDRSKIKLEKIIQAH